MGPKLSQEEQEILKSLEPQKKLIAELEQTYDKKARNYYYNDINEGLDEAEKTLYDVIDIYNATLKEKSLENRKKLYLLGEFSNFWPNRPEAGSTIKWLDEKKQKQKEIQAEIKRRQQEFNNRNNKIPSR